MGGWYSDMMSGWGFGGGWMLIVWIIIIGLVVWGAVALTNTEVKTPHGHSQFNITF